MALERAEGYPNAPGLHAGQRLVRRHRRDRRGRLNVRPPRTEHARAASRLRLPYRACSEGALRASSLRPVANQSSRLVPGKGGGRPWTGGRGALTCAAGDVGPRSDPCALGEVSRTREGLSLVTSILKKSPGWDHALQVPEDFHTDDKMRKCPFLTQFVFKFGVVETINCTTE